MTSSKLEERGVCHVAQPATRLTIWPGQPACDVTAQTLIGLEVVDEPAFQRAARRPAQPLAEQHAQPEHGKERQVAAQSLAETRVRAPTAHVAIEKRLPTLGSK